MSDSISIDPAEAVLAVLGELKRQRTEGLRHLYLEDSTIEGLELLLGKDEKETMAPDDPLPPKSQSSTQNHKIQTAPLETSQAPQPSTEVPHVKPSPLPTNPKFLHPPAISLPQGSKEEQWKWLKKRVLECEVCNAELNEGAQVVFGEGSLEADLFLCGEAPGAEEERAGEPFVGPAGDLLNRIISAMGLSRDSVYIGNVVNFRPRHQNSYGNRPPTVEEINFCLPFLKAQLDIVQPKVIVALGKTATDGLLGADPKRRLGQMRGNWHQYDGVPMMVTYHPSYLLHNPSKSSKRKVWEDMLKVMEKLELPISEKQRSFFQ
jgi:uracil-DNA glycosylase family 4